MTSKPAERIAVIGTGLIGTSVALAAARVGCIVTGWDLDPAVASRATRLAGSAVADSLEECVAASEIVVVAAPISATAELVSRALEAAPEAIVTDAASIKTAVILEAAALADPATLPRFVPGHPMGGSERSGPEHASASVIDGIVWVLTPTTATDESCVDRLQGWVSRIGARPVRMPPERHDRLVAFVSHLPQVASTALMGLATTEEADEPEILLLAAGGFRDLTRLAASNPALWSEILLANREAIAEAIDLYMKGLGALREDLLGGNGAVVEELFTRAKSARLRLAAKPTVRAGVAVLQVVVPDRPGALARLTAVLGEGGVNIEDLQIVHSPEGGRGTVHLTVAAADVALTTEVLEDHDFDPTRLA
jgi:prephenate dehydrogenase